MGWSTCDNQSELSLSDLRHIDVAPRLRMGGMRSISGLQFSFLDVLRQSQIIPVCEKVERVPEGNNPFEDT